MPRTRFVVQALALGLAGVITLSLLAALEMASAQQHRQAQWAWSEAHPVQQVLIVGQRPPRS